MNAREREAVEWAVATLGRIATQVENRSKALGLYPFDMAPGELRREANALRALLSVPTTEPSEEPTLDMPAAEGEGAR